MSRISIGIPEYVVFTSILRSPLKIYLLPESYCKQKKN